MSTAVAHSWFFAKRDLRNLARQPWWIAVSLAQPIIYLLLFAALFKKIVEIPGFGAKSYIDFFTPGVKKSRYDFAPKPGISTILRNSAANSSR